MCDKQLVKRVKAEDIARISLELSILIHNVKKFTNENVLTAEAKVCIEILDSTNKKLERVISEGIF